MTKGSLYHNGLAIYSCKAYLTNRDKADNIYAKEALHTRCLYNEK